MRIKITSPLTLLTLLYPPPPARLSYQIPAAGVTLAQDRAAILEAVNSFLEQLARQLAAPEDSGASAPALEAEGPMGVAECAVCLDNTCEVIFVPCGHMCCCIKCAELVGQCPLCRADINQKVRVIQP
uniref:RING-type domain-containing protein n=1 Tax=Timema poppense TaxID=170557 RepID=A0A7R9CJV7_TIMPO|nr:unnamed protein product [Timema poppensis]